MPTPHVTPSPTATASTWQIGTYNSVSDTWTLVLDLNDRSTWYVKSYDIAQPEKVVSRSGNPRTQGEKITNERYRNRYISLTLMLRSATTLAALDTAIHGLEAALDNTPWMLRFAEIGAAQYTYAIVKSWQHSIPQDPLQRAARVKTGITLVMECEPFLLGDKLYLDNLAINPGFEAPSGPGVQVFSDTFANTNAYATQTGGVPTLAPANTFVDIVAANCGANLLTYYRLGEASGTVAYDIGGMAEHGAYVATPTLGVAGLVSGDTDTAVTFNGTTQYATVPTTNLPTGANPWFILVRTKPTNATNAADCYVASFGDGGTAGHSVGIAQTAAGGWKVATWAGPVVSGGTSAAGVAHTVCGTYDGTSLRLYVDGTLVAGPTAATCAITGTHGAIGAIWTGAAYANFYPGTVDEVITGNIALGATAISNIHTAANTGATGTVTNAMTVPASSRQAFGSPAWGALNTWQVRFRFVAGLTANFYLHFTDGSNALYCQITPTTLTLYHAVAGTAHQLAQNAVTMTHEAWYWLQITQFPMVSNAAPYVQALLFYDDAGGIGSGVTNGALGPVATFDAVTALSGRPQIAASGAALVIGGNYSSVHTVSLFGPGGWYFSPNFSSQTGQASAAWDQNTANTFPSGPVTSYGAARIDFPPAGTFDGRWQTWDASGGATGAAQYGLPTAQNHVLGFSVAYLTTAGLSATSAVRAVFREVSSSGTELTTGTRSILSGTTQTTWASFSTTYTVANANTAYVRLQLQVTDSTANSANATVWFDNVQLWDQTTTGQTSMPYCELRFPQSPAQLMVSGIVGDVPTPVSLAVGTYVSSMAVQHTMNLALGSKATPIAAARLVGPSVVRQTLNASSTIVPTLNSGSYGGFYIQETYTGAGGSFTTFYYALSDTPANLQGVYRLVEQFMTSNSSYSAVQALLTTVVSTGAYDPGSPVYAQRRAFIQIPAITPVTAQNNYLDIGIGPLFIPPYGQDSLMDTTKNFVAPSIWWTDPNAVNTTFYRHGWQALVPVDGSTVLANFTTGTLAAINTSWIWIYANGLDGQLIITGNWTYSLETAALANPANGVGGAGGTGSSSQSINPVGDAFLTLDPTQSSNGVSGVAQLVGYLTNDNPLGQVLPLHVSIQYTPHYLDPR